MALEKLENTSEGYTIIGTTRVGRPVEIKINYSGKPRFEVNVQPFEGTDEDAIFSETELHHLMADSDALTLKLDALCQTHWTDDTEILLSKVISTIEVSEVSPESVLDLLENERALAMGM